MYVLSKESWKVGMGAYMFSLLLEQIFSSGVIDSFGLDRFTVGLSCVMQDV